MNTPLQQAAQALIYRWDTADWKSTKHTAEYVNALRKALADEQAQAVEPVAWLVLDEDRVPIMCAPAKQMCNDHINDAINDFDIAEASKWIIREAFAHPAPPPAGDSASLIRRADASVTALNGRIMEPFYCSLDQDAASVLSDCVDMLESDGAIIGEDTKAQQVAVSASVPMSDSQISDAWESIHPSKEYPVTRLGRHFARAIEKHHGIGAKP